MRDEQSLRTANGKTGSIYSPHNSGARVEEEELSVADDGCRGTGSGWIRIGRPGAEKNYLRFFVGPILGLGSETYDEND